MKIITALKVKFATRLHEDIPAYIVSTTVILALSSEQLEAFAEPDTINEFGETVITKVFEVIPEKEYKLEWYGSFEELKLVYVEKI